MPPRYFERVVATARLAALDAIFVEVTSSVDAEPQAVSAAGLRSGGGVWLVRDDMTPRGEFLPCEVQGTRQFFGIGFEPEDVRVLLNAAESLGHGFGPLALYHGTALADKSSIALFGLRASTSGMLGPGYYCGSFWKAARFAVRSQTYEMRPGAIFRCLYDAGRIVEFPRPGWACSCDLCQDASHVATRTVSDHSGAWRLSARAAVARASTASIGTCRDGTPRYALRNEEWCLSTAPLLVNWARIDPQSAHHDPLDRKIKMV